MIVKYVHASEPRIEKFYNTEKALKNNPFIRMSQKEFDEMELKRFQENKAEGYIARFEIQKGNK